MVVPPMQSISGNNNGTYTLYMVPPHGRYGRFAMPAMYGALAAEVRWLLINSQDFGCIWSVTVISLAIPHLLIPGFLRFTWVGSGLGHLIPNWSVCWKCREHPQLLSTTKQLINPFLPMLKKKFCDHCRPSWFVSKIGSTKITYRAPSITQSILKLIASPLHQTNRHFSVFWDDVSF